MAFSHPVRVYWEDTDAGGIVFYANYLKFFERARTEWLRSLGFGQQALREATGGMFVVLETQLRYRAPARLDDELRVTARLDVATRASLTLVQEAWRAVPQVLPASGATAASAAATASDVLLCEGSVRIGWVDAAAMRPARMPAGLLEALQPKVS